MTHIVSVELSEEAVARLGDLASVTGAPPAELVRAAVEAKYGHRPNQRHGPHQPVQTPRKQRRPDPATFAEYGGEG